MKLSEYKQLAIRTESVIDQAKLDVTQLQALIGIIIGAGNLLDVIKKDTFYGLPTALDKLTKRSELIAKSQADLITNFNKFASIQQNGTVNAAEILAVNPRVFHAIVGITTESIELLEALNRSIDRGTDVDTVNVGEEIADISWYTAIAVDALKLDWESLLEANIAKLQARYPTKFSGADAHARDVVKERVILETATKTDQPKDQQT